MGRIDSMKIKKSTKDARTEFCKIPFKCPNCNKITKVSHLFSSPSLYDILESAPAFWLCKKAD